MLAVTIGSFPADPMGCATCCCETVALKAGETLPLRLDYAPWAAPFARRGLHCVPAIEIEEKQTCDLAQSSNMPPQTAGPVIFIGPASTLLQDDLKDQITDPETQPLTFKLLPLYGPKRGKLNLAADGTFDYTPMTGWTGVERFYVSASDAVNSRIFEVMLGIGVTQPTVVPTPDFTTGPPMVDQRLFIVTIPLIAAPSAQTCQVFRLTVRQGALDCDCNCYQHVDCVDVRIVKC